MKTHVLVRREHLDLFDGLGFRGRFGWLLGLLRAGFEIPLVFGDEQLVDVVNRRVCLLEQRFEILTALRVLGLLLLLSVDFLFKLVEAVRLFGLVYERGFQVPLGGSGVLEVAGAQDLRLFDTRVCFALHKPHFAPKGFLGLGGICPLLLLLRRRLG